MTLVDTSIWVDHLRNTNELLKGYLVEGEVLCHPMIVAELALGVRRQGFWDRWLPDLRECVAHLVGLIMRRIFGEASVALRGSFV